jgi:hypothetical protein
MSITRPPVTCRAPGDRCFGCDHYTGNALLCRYAAPEVIAAHNLALLEAAAIARANTSAPRIWRDGAWFNPHGEDIAVKIEALMVLT